MNIRKYIVALAVAALAGCTGNFDEINRNRDQVTREEMERENYILGSSLKGLQGLVVTVQEHRYQFVEALSASAFAGYMEFNVERTTKFSTFNPTQDWAASPFNDQISDTYPLYRDIYKQTDDPVALAMADVLRVAIMHRVTDMFGPIPYSKIMDNIWNDEGLEEGEAMSLTAAYDPQDKIYETMFGELDAALAVFDANSGLSAEAFRKFDAVYYGDIGRWIRYTNSLKLRMAMRTVYVDGDNAKRRAEEAVAGGVIERNDDNAMMHVEENRTSLLFSDNWQDYGAGADILSYMNGYKDPRREKMFTKGSKTSGYPAVTVNDFFGMRIGIDNTDKEGAQKSYSQPIVKSTDPLLWMNAAEVTFLRAEGALRGWAMGGDAKKLYNDAIALSFAERGVSGAGTYVESTDTPEKYTDSRNGRYSANSPASNITVKWNEGTGSNVLEENLERIITQKWIAIFPLGNEAWAEYRRTGYPKLLPVELNKSGNTIDSAIGIRRLNYPADEYTENETNVRAAVEMLGGPDNGGTRLWWDCKN